MVCNEVIIMLLYHIKHKLNEGRKVSSIDHNYKQLRMNYACHYGSKTISTNDFELVLTRARSITTSSTE